MLASRRQGKQRPRAHVWPVGHTTLQPPQFIGSLARSAHAVALQHWPAAPLGMRQNVRHEEHVCVMHTPPPHALPAGHPPAPPQSVWSLASGRQVATGPPLKGPMTAQTPDAHVRPHAPQFGSRPPLTQAPPQQMPAPTALVAHEVPSGRPVQTSRQQKFHGTPPMQWWPVGQSASALHPSCATPPSGRASTQSLPPWHVASS